MRALILTLFVMGAGANAAQHPLSLWQLAGSDNRVYLLGSVHLLRDSDYPLPAEIDAAYADADVLFMELDLDDMQPAATQALVADLGTIRDGRTLADWLGAETYGRALAIARDIDVKLQQFAATEPWLAAVTVEQIMLSRIGFDSALGVEAHMLQKATTDGKEIMGLETIEEQLGFLDNLSLESQRALLLQTLEEATEIGTAMDRLIDAWRRGDVDFLEAETLSSIESHPELHEALVVNRNRSWTQKIQELLDDDDDYLVIVGALHLVGDDSVLAMLRANGHRIEQLRHSSAP